jgi:hypothetical protein
MKLIQPIILSCSFLLVFASFAPAQENEELPAEGSIPRLNFLVSPKQKHFDQAAFSFQFQAVLHRFFARNTFHLVVAGSSEQMARQIVRILKRKHAMIGSLWFDSHGHFTRRRSLFEVGKDEFNSESIKDSSFTIYLKKLAAYCDAGTHIGIGSCYGGSTCTLPAVENFPEQRMNGDSLMIGVSHLLNNASVYACESFVLTQPGIFTDSYKLSGSPGRKKFEDSLYLPIWENLGQWNCYEGSTQKFSRVNAVSLSFDGSIYTKKKNYHDSARHRRKLQRKLMKLKRGNYNLGYLYQEV